MEEAWRELCKDAAAASERLPVDSTILRAHQHAGGRRSPSRRGSPDGGVGTKAHFVAYDAKTSPAVTITPG